ncbi:hypothetical protein [Sulfitobacter dubius]|uniref:hypothetical protein n=1 Tax=Sulfitobacter dubius TaxID=218673 RepID=UPI000B88B6C6|nr:hypothetical protein [Sulfitobacter dubius]
MQQSLHEAGHLLAALLSPLPTPVRAWMTARGGHVEPAPLPTITPKLAEAKLRMCLAGRAAEALVLGEVSNGAGLGPTSDLAQATKLALEMDLNWSFGGADLVWRDASQVDFDRLPIRTQQRLRATLQDAEVAVSSLLEENLHSLKRIAAELICKRELTGRGLDELSKDLFPSQRSLGTTRLPECPHNTS